MRFSKQVYDDAFHCDGSLRDLYVRWTSLHDWQRLLNFLTSTRYRLSFQTDGRPGRVPTDPTELFRVNARPLLRIDLGGVTLNCHFFVTEEIELDLDPEELNNDDDHVGADAVLSFMSELGTALQRAVLMTAENASDAVIFRYDPATEQLTYEPGRGEGLALHDFGPRT